MIVFRLCVVVSASFLIASAARAQAPSAVSAIADFAIGNVTVSGADGRIRTLTKGGVLESGDRIQTNDGRAQIRFSDGGYMSLQPGTELTLRDYQYDGRSDGNERNFMSMARGAMRAVTGQIGRVNRSRYLITTPTATIGVRGTGGLIEITADGSTRVLGTSGIWLLSNAAGALEVPAGTAAVATRDVARPPQRSAQAPNVPAPGPAKTIATANAPAPDSAAPTGSNPSTAGDSIAARTAIIKGPSPGSPPPASSTPLVSGLYNALVSYGYEVATAAGTPGTAADTLDLTNGAATAASVGAGSLVTSIGQLGNSTQGPAGQNAEGGNNGVLAWGRWVGNVSGLGAANANIGATQGLHYVLGTPTAIMPVANPGAVGVVPFTLAAATSPTLSEGAVAPGQLAGRLGVNFATGRVGVDMTASFTGFQVGMQTAGGATDPSRSGVTFGVGNAQFGGALDTVTVTGAGKPAGFCPTGCNGSVRGFFAGANAAQAGLIYNVSPNGNGTTQMTGAAVFKQ